MTSACVLWNYHRKLSLGATGANHVDHKDIQQQRRRTLSTSSGCQIGDRENRRDSESEEDELDVPKSNESKPKTPRRFSLDFLFSRRSKKGQKTQRTKSVSDPSSDEQPCSRRYRLPSMTGAEYALAM